MDPAKEVGDVFVGALDLETHRAVRLVANPTDQVTLLGLSLGVVAEGDTLHPSGDGGGAPDRCPHRYTDRRGPRSFW